MNPTNSNVHKLYDTFAHFWWNVGHSVHQDPVVLRSCCPKWIFVLRFCSFGNILCKLSTSFALEHFLRLLSFLWWYHTDKWKTSSIKGWVFNPGERLERLERRPIRQTPLSTWKWTLTSEFHLPAAIIDTVLSFIVNAYNSCATPDIHVSTSCPSPGSYLNLPWASPSGSPAHEPVGVCWWHITCSASCLSLDSSTNWKGK